MKILRIASLGSTFTGSYKTTDFTVSYQKKPWVYVFFAFSFIIPTLEVWVIFCNKVRIFDETSKWY